MTELAVSGWVLALLAAWRVLTLARRLELVACAEHELRGPLAALTLAAARSRPLPAAVVEGQLERARIALTDVTHAREGSRAAARAERHEARLVAERTAAGWSGTGAEVELDWRAGAAVVDADPGRISQALGNLLSNALEHGRGRVSVRGVRADGRLRIEVSDSGGGFVRRPRRGRGRGLAIATRAVEEAGGRLRLSSGPDGTTAAVELPLADG